MAFSFNYKDLNYDQARNQAHQQVNPSYQSALAKVQEQKRQNQMNAGQMATARGLSHSGLAADQQNKVAIAAQGQVADLERDKTSQISQLAQSLIDRDRTNSDRLYNRAYSQYRDGVSDNRYNKQFDYQKARDQVGDNRYSQEFGYQKTRDNVTDNRWNQEFNYRKSRDDVGDQQQKDALAFEKQRFNSETEWRSYVYNNMSATEKAQLEWNKQQYGESMAWSIEESNRSDKLARDQMEFSAGQSGFQTP